MTTLTDIAKHHEGNKQLNLVMRHDRVYLRPLGYQQLGVLGLVQFND